MSPLGGADQFSLVFSTQPDTSFHCETTDTRLITYWGDIPVLADC